MRVLTGLLVGLGIGASLGLVVLWLNTAPDVVHDRGRRSAVASVDSAVPRRSDGRVDRLMRDGERQARQPRRETQLSAPPPSALAPSGVAPSALTTTKTAWRRSTVPSHPSLTAA